MEKYIFRGTFDWIVCGVVCGAGDGIVITGDPPEGAKGVLPPTWHFEICKPKLSERNREIQKRVRKYGPPNKIGPESPAIVMMARGPGLST